MCGRNGKCRWYDNDMQPVRSRNVCGSRLDDMYELLKRTVFWSRSEQLYEQHGGKLSCEIDDEQHMYELCGRL